MKTPTAECKLKALFERSSDAASYVWSAGERMSELIRQLDHVAIGKVVNVVAEAGAAGRSVFTIGNGGSAAVASHFVNDMGVNSWVAGQPGIHVQCLCDNFASVTAVANDVSFEDVFRRQLECSLRAADVLIAMSVSGNSENIVRAVEYASEIDAVTVGMCGFDGGRLAQVAEHIVHVPSTPDEYGPVEDAFSIVCHMISSYLTMQRGRFLHH